MMRMIDDEDDRFWVATSTIYTSGEIGQCISSNVDRYRYVL